MPKQAQWKILTASILLTKKRRWELCWEIRGKPGGLSAATAAALSKTPHVLNRRRVDADEARLGAYPTGLLGVYLRNRLVRHLPWSTLPCLRKQPLGASQGRRGPLGAALATHLGLQHRRGYPLLFQDQLSRQQTAARAVASPRQLPSPNSVCSCVLLRPIWVAITTPRCLRKQRFRLWQRSGGSGGST